MLKSQQISLSEYVRQRDGLPSWTNCCGIKNFENFLNQKSLADSIRFERIDNNWQFSACAID